MRGRKKYFKISRSGYDELCYEARHIAPNNRLTALRLFLLNATNYNRQPSAKQFFLQWFFEYLSVKIRENSKNHV